MEANQKLEESMSRVMDDEDMDDDRYVHTRYVYQFVQYMNKYINTPK